METSHNLGQKTTFSATTGCKWSITLPMERMKSYRSHVSATCCAQLEGKGLICSGRQAPPAKQFEACHHSFFRNIRTLDAPLAAPFLIEGQNMRKECRKEILPVAFPSSIGPYPPQGVAQLLSMTISLEAGRNDLPAASSE